MTDSISAADVEALVARFEASDLTELHVSFPGFELHLSTNSNAVFAAGPAPPAAALAAPPPTPSLVTESYEGLEIVTAPYQGTFYLAPKPGEPAFVQIGQSVKSGADLCLIEVMKLFTAVRATAAGTVVKVLAEDGALVQGGQPLFAISAGA